jgi:hypothetical protein
MNRRDILKMAGGIGTATAIGTGALMLGSRGARATGGANYGSANVTSDDGSVDYVAIYGDSIVTWDGFDSPAASFRLTIDVEVIQDWDGQTAASQQVHQTDRYQLEEDGDWGQEGESYTIGNSDTDEATAGTIKSDVGLDSQGNHDPEIDWHIIGSDPDNYGLPNNPIDASALSTPDNGGTREFTVRVKTTYEWFDANVNVIFGKTFTSDVDLSVTNEEATASGQSGTGEDGATAT